MITSCLEHIIHWYQHRLALWQEGCPGGKPTPLHGLVHVKVPSFAFADTIFQDLERTRSYTLFWMDTKYVFSIVPLACPLILITTVWLGLWVQKVQGFQSLNHCSKPSSTSKACLSWRLGWYLLCVLCLPTLHFLYMHTHPLCHSLTEHHLIATVKCTAYDFINIHCLPTTVWSEYVFQLHHHGHPTHINSSGRHLCLCNCTDMHTLATSARFVLCLCFQSLACAQLFERGLSSQRGIWAVIKPQYYLLRGHCRRGIGGRRWKVCRWWRHWGYIVLRHRYIVFRCGY
jgi:hypothetical protein